MSRARGFATTTGGCCREWAGLPDGRRELWQWQSLHEFAHSRIPFSAPLYADVAHLTPVEAEANIDSALHFGWVVRVVDDHAGPNCPPLWQGKLTKRR